MKRHPILFCSEMVKAIIAGRKTQTRRVIKPQPIVDFDSGYVFYRKHQFDIHNMPLSEEILKYCPYGQCGEVLWVRETWGWYGTIISGSYGYCPPEEPRWPPAVIKGGFRRPIIYKADYPKHRFDPNDSGWKPSIHMPYSACRIWLDIVDIRVERLHDIKNEDCIEEGIERTEFGWKNYQKSYPVNEFMGDTGVEELKSYQSLWFEINGEESWYNNPYVWVIEFKVKEILT
ncbi:MAG: hypothetical protein GYA14_15855 [Ignavibacteria bacterium]|nr:hypothetical protein [Ignavibacteria bacterium]